MELIIDSTFRSAHGLYFRGLSEEAVFKRINGIFERYDPEMVLDAVNIVKTAIALGMTYSDCHDKTVETIIKRFPPSDDIDLFILSVTMKLLIAMGSESVEELLFKPRDINKEVAAKYFRVPLKKVTKEMTEAVVQASENFTKKSYSIDDPPVANWDEYFYNVCRQVARNSKCLSRRIGAVLVWDKGIISTGYNGPPRGVPRCDMRWKIDKEFNDKYKDKVEGKELEGICPRYAIGFESGTGLEICPAGHAERNAIINAARKGIKTKGTLLYMTCGIPCTPCLVEIINAGVKEIVVTSLKIYDETAMYLLNQSTLSVRLYDFVK
jgi:dCMP deaminase